MAVVGHQAIKLSRGWHDSPDEGACVMELASVLAGEEFSDEPVSAAVHNDETHAEVLALVDELRAIKPGGDGLPAASIGQKPAAGPSRRLRSGRAQPPVVGSM